MTTDPLQRAQELLGRMTIEEKVAQVTGVMPLSLLESGLGEAELEKQMGRGIGYISMAACLQVPRPPADLARVLNRVQRFLVEHTRLGIPAIVHNEALNSVVAPHYTVFPTAIGLAATWNPAGVEAMATIIRQQMRSVGMRQALSPVMDVARDARWGRVHETYGEDPYLVSAMSVAYIRGLQGENLQEGVLATGKHFLGYALTEGGQNTAATQLGSRELYEVYARPFEAAIKQADLASVMNSYSTVNGIPVAASREILTDLLRGRMGFEGTVVSDFNSVIRLKEHALVATSAQEAAVLALAAGVDVELPTPATYAQTLAEAVQKGIIAEAALDEAVLRVLRDKFALGLFDHSYVPEHDPISINELTREGADLSQALAQQSITLLKNNGILPLDKTIRKIAIVGPHAESVDVAFPNYTYPSGLHVVRFIMQSGRYRQGEYASADFRPSEEQQRAQKELEALLSTDPEALVRQMYGSESLAEAVRRLLPEAQVTVERGTGVLDDESADIPAAVQAASEADVVILALGGRSRAFGSQCTEGEGSDAADIDLPVCQVKLVKAVAAIGVPLVAVVLAGRPFGLASVIDQFSAVVYGYYGGQAAGTALAEVLLGHVNAGGKLPYSLPRHTGQVPLYARQHNGSGYRRTSADYHRGYIDGPSTPLFAFGHGLSYTTFAYDTLTLSAHEVSTDGHVSVSARITNTGSRVGDEVVQLYFSDTALGVTRPAQELVGFKRVHLDAGASVEVTFTIQMSQLGYIGLDGLFCLEPGPIGVRLGASSDDIRLEDRFEVVGERITLEGRRSYLSSVAIRLLEHTQRETGKPQ